MPSLLHRQAEDGGYRWPRGQIPPAVRKKLTPGQIQRRVCCQGASGSDAPFAFRGRLLTLVLAAAVAHGTPAADCPASHIDEHVQAVHVYDGDTIKLQDGRRVRLIGINTPEIGRNGSPSGPLAEEARTTLRELLDAGHGKLLLQYGTERHDRYGRLLAHAFLQNGENIAVSLLQQGLATTLVVPPNTWARDCYQDHEDQARRADRGLWGLVRGRSDRGSPFERDGGGKSDSCFGCNGRTL